MAAAMVDLNTLSRRELQALCKLNGVRANMTNVAMVEALHSLYLSGTLPEVVGPAPAAGTLRRSQRSQAARKATAPSAAARSSIVMTADLDKEEEEDKVQQKVEPSGVASAQNPADQKATELPEQGNCKADDEPEQQQGEEGPAIVEQHKLVNAQKSAASLSAMKGGSPILGVLSKATPEPAMKNVQDAEINSAIEDKEVEAIQVPQDAIKEDALNSTIEAAAPAAPNNMVPAAVTEKEVVVDEKYDLVGESSEEAGLTEESSEVDDFEEEEDMLKADRTVDEESDEIIESAAAPNIMVPAAVTEKEVSAADLLQADLTESAEEYDLDGESTEEYDLSSQLHDNVLWEILLRLPPQPSSLPRASAVSKRWRSIASDPGFCSRFRRHHRRNPPLLGFFDQNEPQSLLSFVPTIDAPNCILPWHFSMYDDPYRYVPHGSRHGLVLIIDNECRHVVVWNPVTHDQHRAEIPLEFREFSNLNGSVLRDAGDVHFRVILAVSNDEDQRALARLYSSETGLWSDLISGPLPPGTLHMSSVPAVLVGDSLYWQLHGSCGILEFNFERQSLVVIPLPVDTDPYHDRLSVIREEGGGLGLIFVSHFTAQLWKMETGRDGIESWVLGRTIELDELLCLNPDEHEHIWIEGYAEENNVVFLETVIDLVMLQLPSLKFKFIRKTSEYIKCYRYHPFESIYTAGEERTEYEERDSLTGEEEDDCSGDLSSDLASLSDAETESGNSSVALKGIDAAAAASSAAKTVESVITEEITVSSEEGVVSQHLETIEKSLDEVAVTEEKKEECAKERRKQMKVGAETSPRKLESAYKESQLIAAKEGKKLTITTNDGSRMALAELDKNNAEC